MKCAMCDGAGTVRALPWNGDVVVSVMCAAHEWACVSAVMHNDFEAVEVAILVADPSFAGEGLSARARAMATLRLLALAHTDRPLLDRIGEAVQALPDDADDTDIEWAALSVLREAGMS